MAQHELQVAASANRQQPLCEPTKKTTPPPPHKPPNKEEEVDDDAYDEDDEDEDDDDEGEGYQSEHSSDELLADSSLVSAQIEQLARTIRESMPAEEREKQEQKTEDIDEYFRRMFKMPRSEKLVEDFYCSYYGRMLYQGRMYISQNFICFHSNILGFRIMLTIPFREIQSISKQNTIGFVPNAIEIRTSKNHSYFFGSFMFRDQTFAILSELLKLHQRKAKFVAKNVGSSSGNPPNDSDISESYEEDDEGGEDDDEEDDDSCERESNSDTDRSRTQHSEGHVDDHVDRRAPLGGQTPMQVAHSSPNLKAMVPPSSLPTQLPNLPAPIVGGQGEKTTVMSTSPPTRTVPAAEQEQKQGKDTNGNKGQESTNNNNNSNAGQEGNQQQGASPPNNNNGSSANGTGGDGDGGDDKKKQQPDNDKSNDSTLKKRKKKKKREESGNTQEEATNTDGTNNEEEPTFLSDNAIDSTQVPPIDNMFWSPDKNYKPKEIFHTIIPLPLVAIFGILFNDSGDLEKMYHQARGDTDLVITPFQPAKNNLGKIREVKFLNVIKNKPVSFGPSKTRVVTTQRVILFKGKKKCLNQFSMISLDVPYGDCFKIQTDMEFVEREDKQACDVRCNLGLIFVKSVNFLFRGTIEDFALNETSQSLKFWIEQAKQLVSKHATRAPPKQERRKLKDSRRKHKVEVGENIVAPESTTTQAAPLTMGEEVAPSKMDFSTGFSSTSLETQDMDGGGSLLVSLMKIPGALCDNVQIPLWIALLLALLILFFVLPQQYKLNSAIGRLEYQLLHYKEQQTRFEQEMHALMLGITTNVTSPEKLKSKLDEWMKSKASNDPERFAIQTLLASTLDQLDKFRKIANRLNGGDPTSTTHANPQQSAILWHMLHAQQQQQSLQQATTSGSFVNLQYWFIAFAIVAFAVHRIMFRAS